MKPKIEIKRSVLKMRLSMASFLDRKKMDSFQYKIDDIDRLEKFMDHLEKDIDKTKDACGDLFAAKSQASYVAKLQP